MNGPGVSVGVSVAFKLSSLMSKIKKTNKNKSHTGRGTKISVSLLGLDLNYHDFLVDQVRQLWLTQVILQRDLESLAV